MRHLLTSLSADLRYAWRGLRRTPVFTLVAVLSIALGIGANTAVFTLVDQVLLRLLPVKDPEQIVQVLSRGFHYGNTWGDGNELSYPMFADLRDHVAQQGDKAALDGLFCRFGQSLAVSAGGRTERVEGELVSGAYFDLLGVGAHLGRTIGPDEDRVPGGHPIVVLSHAYWKSRFASDPTIVGSPITISNIPMTIVGVAQEGFDGLNLGTAAQVYVSIAMAEQLTSLERGLHDRRTRWVNAFARLRPHVTPEQAQASLQPFYASRRQMEAQEPAFARASGDDKARFLKGTIAIEPAAHGRSDLRRRVTHPLGMLMAMVACVLLIACANVANLLLARASTRERELAVRLALGASRRRIVQQLLVESLLLALLGGLAGLALATWSAGALLGFFTSPDTMLTVSARPDLRILAFTLAVSIGTGVLFGLMPARQSTRPALAPTLKNEAGSVIGGSPTHLRSALVIAQVALSLLLLIAAGLFIRSLHNLMTLNPGFDTTRLISFSVDPRMNGYQQERGRQFKKALLERVQATPGVQSAAIASHGLLEGGSWNSTMTIAGLSNTEGPQVVTFNNTVSPGYFAAMGMRLLAGRDFDARDERVFLPNSAPPWEAPGFVIANAEFVRRYLRGGPALGRRLGFGRDPGTPTPLEIVGVVSDAKYTRLRDEMQPQLFFPYFGAAVERGVMLYVRTAQDPETMFQTLRRVVQQVDPHLPLFALQTFDERVERSLANERLVASLSAVFGVLATLLAMIGLYGVMAYSVARRTREIGIRMALGAVRGHVTWMVLRDVARLVAIGLAIGLPVAWVLSRYVRSQLYGVMPTDLPTFAAALAMLVAVAGLAGLIPARRAARVNPISALRHE